MKHTKIICFSTPRFQESMAMREILAAMGEKYREVGVQVIDYNWLLLPQQAHVSVEDREKVDKFVEELKKIVADRKVGFIK